MPAHTWVTALPENQLPLPQVLYFAMPAGNREQDRAAFQEVLDQVNNLTAANSQLIAVIAELRAVIVALP